MALSVVLAGGGTGGHIFPALALADEIRRLRPQAYVRFIGALGGLETDHVPRAGFPLETVPARAVAGRGPLHALAGLATLWTGILEARRHLRSVHTHLVIGVGGYASVPAAAAAVWLGIPLALLEPNAHPGRTNRRLARWADAVFVQFEEALPFFPADRTRQLGYPVRRLPGSVPTRAPGAALELLVVGGSQGAHSLNRAFAEDLEPIAKRSGLHVTHQTGARDLAEVRAAYERHRVAATVKPFFDDLPERLARADLVVARAGAGTLAELCAAGVPSILVPYPHAADDHQAANARALESQGAALVVPDESLAGRIVGESLALLDDAARRRRMAEAARRMARPDAGRRIAEACLALAEQEAAA